MNEADLLYIEQLRTKPWRELSIIGAHITEKVGRGRRKKDPKPVAMTMHLAWLEGGDVSDQYNAELKSSMTETDLLDYFNEVVAFSKGAIPVAWGAQSRAVLRSFVKENIPSGVDLDLCFLLRPGSRWLDPSIWCRHRTGKHHEMDTILRSVGIPKGPNQGIDVARLAYLLPMRDGFPVKPEWTASETAQWQETVEMF